ncbi:MAG: Inner membrane protein YtfF [Chlamydiales bacterium]|nr:Inner membrane protein YtfF [Chlamydiales bacterium]MCH9619093.1 Inner membrane protein YtfF [Chlamydiales bacterium]MCH9622355.1 Inner membrane protein YtfF [Chlamydiales bacterium]
MTLGILFAVGACLVWGLIFIIPTFMSEFSTFEVVLGRYVCYGIFSSLLLFRKGFAALKIYNLRVWLAAALFALCANIIYYIGLVMGIRYASPALAVLCVGLSPIVIVCYGNWKVREISYRQMFFPSLWIAVGLVLVNFTEVDWTFSQKSWVDYLIGMGGIAIALICWSLYVVHNARFLKRNSHIPTSQWATVIGVATLFWVIICGIALGWGFKMIDFSQLTTYSGATVRFYSGSIILGVISSWIGCYLWNRASSYLPVSLIGPLMILETVFGLTYVYLVEFNFPSLIESLGVISMLGGTGLAINSFKNTEFTHS